MSNEIIRSANFSKDGMHRFWLMRSWTDQPKMVTIIGLNPSTADAEYDDPTIRSCIRLVKQNGYGGFVMCNLFTYISPSPLDLSVAIAVGNGNRKESNDTLVRMIANSHKAICAWGNFRYDDRAREVLSMIKEPMCFGKNGNGSPCHPLYLKTDTPLIQFN
jgi:hypothetical protein